MEKRVTIRKLIARQVLDSSGRPMVEVDALTSDGHIGRGASPCGTSVGRHEAVVLRDGGKAFGGLGVTGAIENVEKIIAPSLEGKVFVDNQEEVDRILIDLDGTESKSLLGANALYSVSIAVARAAAASSGVPLYRYLSKGRTCGVPVPAFNMINGGDYPECSMAFQEFMLIPKTASSFHEALQMGVEVFRRIGEVIKAKYGRRFFYIGYSSGHGSPVEDPANAIEILYEAVDQEGYSGCFNFALDCASSHFFDNATMTYNVAGKKMFPNELLNYLKKLIKEYGLSLIEDPFHEDDFESFSKLTQETDIIVVGDDLFVTNLKRLERGIQIGAANALLLKPNMVGTLTEAIQTADFAKNHGYHVIPSGRAGGGIMDPITDIAVALAAPLVKTGAPRSGERTAQQNELLRIEEDLGAHFFSAIQAGHPFG